jgi:hypothetical protein
MYKTTGCDPLGTGLSRDPDRNRPLMEENWIYSDWKIPEIGFAWYASCHFEAVRFGLGIFP